ncbi:MAG: response regulator [Myxococcota bacterium]
MEKVLVAEDSTTQRKLFCALLAQLSLEPVEATNGTEAVELLLRPDGPRVALIDWEMPGLSGVEVCRRVREASLPVRPHLILVTSRTDRRDVVEALRAGADDYLSKPPDPGELQARVGVGLRNLGLQQELQQRIAQLEGALRRLDVVGATAAQLSGRAQGRAAKRQGALRPELESLDAFRGLPERFASVVAGLRTGDGVAVEGPFELWAHLALALPAQGSWLDVTLHVSRALAAAAFEQLAGKAPGSDQALLDSVSDVLSLVVRGAQQQLEAHGVEVVRALAAKAFVGAGGQVEAPQRLRLDDGGWALEVCETPAAVAEVPFRALDAGTMLVRSLTPPQLPAVEVLARGTVLKASYLTRASAFFKGDAAATPVAVMTPSAFSLARR